MRQIVLLAVLGAFALGGCSENEEKASEDPKVTQAPRDPDPVDDAVFSIPPEKRDAFRRALLCEIEKNEGPAITLDPSYIRTLYQRLEADPTIAECDA